MYTFHQFLDPERLKHNQHNPENSSLIQKTSKHIIGFLKQVPFQTYQHKSKRDFQRLLTLFVFKGGTIHLFG